MAELALNGDPFSTVKNAGEAVIETTASLMSYEPETDAEVYPKFFLDEVSCERKELQVTKDHKNNRRDGRGRMSVDGAIFGPRQANLVLIAYASSLHIRTVSPETSLLAHTSSESRETFRQKARSLAPLNGWACAVKICHLGMLEDGTIPNDYKGYGNGQPTDDYCKGLFYH